MQEFLESVESFKTAIADDGIEPAETFIDALSSDLSDQRLFALFDSNDTFTRPDHQALDPLERRYWELIDRIDNGSLKTPRFDSKQPIPTKKMPEINYATLTDRMPSSLPMREIDELLVYYFCFYHHRKQTKMFELLALGTNTLEQVKDKFFCLSDHLRYDETNDERPAVSAGYFLVDDCFYNEKRNNVEDYSQNIIDWAGTENEQNYKISSMDTKLKDINLDVNKPYWYVHQGDCEHLVVVKDIRLLHSSDYQNANDYPKTIFRSKIRRHKCRMCNNFPAKLITVNDKYCGESPCFFCDKCYKEFHFNAEGELLYDDFQVFPYMYD